MVCLLASIGISYICARVIRIINSTATHFSSDLCAGDDMSLSRPSRADEERVMRTRRRPQIGDAIHEPLQDWLAHHEKSLEQILRHGRGGETGDGGGAHSLDRKSVV